MYVERNRIRQTGKLAASVMNDLRVRTFTHIQRLSLDYFTEEKAGVIMTRMTSDIEVLQQLLQDGIAQFFIQALTMVDHHGVLFAYNWKLALDHGPRSVSHRSPLVAVVPLRRRAKSYLLGARHARGCDLGHRREPLGRPHRRVVQPAEEQRHPPPQRARQVPGRELLDGPDHRGVHELMSDFIGLGGQLLILLIGGAMVLHSYHSADGFWARIRTRSSPSVS